MCGIAGILDRTQSLNSHVIAARAEAMGNLLRHRGPDDNDVWVDPAAGVALAHRRLAVIAPSAEGHQPATSRCARYILSYNGEIYNFRDIQRQLAEDGHPIESESDTVVLLEAIAHWGVRRTVERAVGMFALAVFDRQAHELTLVRDRLGIKPLYWGTDGSRFVFGSEIKAIRAAELLNLTRDRDALAAYMRFGYIPAPASIYREVRKVMPGTILTIGPSGDAHETRYWDAAVVARDGQADLLPVDDPAVDIELERLLQQAVENRMISDVPLGAWLSGGIDSSAVVALMQHASTEKVRTFSIGFSAFGYDEAADARAIAEHLGTDHNELQVTPRDAIDAIEALPYYYDEPFADSSQIPTFILSRMTRAHVTVALSGDGGDEVFAGYNRYQALPSLARRFAPWPKAGRTWTSRAMRRLPPRAWDRLAQLYPGRLPPQLGDKIWKAADVIEADSDIAAYLSTVSQWPDPHTIVRGARQNQPVISLDNALSDPVARMQLADTCSYLPDDILTKVDRASMAHALEVRVPLLDHRVIEFAWRLPRNALIAGGRTKMPLRRVLERHVPAHLFERPKSGFAIPIGDWMRGPLRDWAEDLLSEKALEQSDMLSPAPVRAAWADHLSGRRNLQNQLWAVLMFQLWDRGQTS